MIWVRIALLGLLTGLILSGCEPGPPRGEDFRVSIATEKKAPEWYIDPPASEDFLATGVSAVFGNLTANYLSAATHARIGLLQQLETRITISESKFEPQKDKEEDELLTEFPNITKLVSRSILYGSQIERVAVYPDEALVYVMGSLPSSARRETLFSPQGNETLAALTGLGIGVKLTGADGRSVDAETMAEWSARIDLSQALWVKAGNLTRQFVESVDDEGKLRDNFVSARKLQFPLLPSSLIEIVETHSLTDDIVVTHVRLRSEWWLEWVLLLNSESWAGVHGEALQATIKLYMEETKLAEDHVWRGGVFEYAGPEFSMLSRYSQPSGEEVTSRDSLVHHPAPNREVPLRDWLASEAITLAFQGKGGSGQGQVESNVELYRRFKATEVFKELEKEIEEYEKQQEK